VSLYFSAANGTADGTDYAAASGVIDISPGQLSASVAVLIFGDAFYEPNETIVVNLTAPTNAILADAQGVITVVNDDVAPPAPEVHVVRLLGSKKAVLWDGQTAAVNFGKARTNANPLSVTFLVYNKGKVSLTLKSLKLPKGFKVIDNLALKVLPGKFDKLVVQLPTAAAGTRSGKLSFVTNDADEKVFDFPITGTVVTAGKRGVVKLMRTASGGLEPLGHAPVFSARPIADDASWLDQSDPLLH
jgi:hypothetical protein